MALRRVFVALSVIAAGLFVAAPPASAATCKVPSTAYPTINSATADGACTTIKLGKGPFFENVTVTNPGTTIVGKGGDCSESPQTIIDASPLGADATGTAVTADNITIKNLVIRHGNNGIYAEGDNFVGSGLCIFGQRGGGDENAGVTLTGDNGTVKNAELHSMDGDGVLVQAPSDSATVTRVHVHNSGSNCVHARRGDFTVTASRLFDCDDQGVRTDDPAELTAEDNVIKNVNNGVEHGSRRGATVRRNRIDTMQDKGIRVNTGPGATTVSGNVVVSARHRCLEISIDTGPTTVDGNHCMRTGGVEVNADIDPVVRDNRIDQAWENHGFQLRCDVECSGAQWVGNSVGSTLRDHNGFELEASDGGGLLAENTAKNSGNNGFLIRLDGWTIRDNQAIATGKRESANDRNGFRFDGASGNTVTGNIARGGRDDGFHLTSSDTDGNTFTSNQSIENVKDGFHISDTGAENNEFDANRAIGNHAEGFENDGTDTDYTNNVAKRNRTDCVGNDGDEDLVTGNTCADGSDFDAAPPNGSVD